ncbi:putative nuclease HARBI1 [Mya arenaria]|uniref:putative nuclease HARBI1 n=1 Tax=Mya arenaria TaxID=6604 RepID=UPI0022E7CBC8|nr:putative nuclease HARBI1 [Mya arenaria]
MATNICAAEKKMLIGSAWQFLEFQSRAVDIFAEQIDSDNNIFIISAAQIRENATRSINFFEETIPRYSFDEFRQHFRLTRPSFEIILTYLGSMEGQGPTNKGRKQIPLEKELLVTLWYLGNLESIRSISDRFNITRSSVYKCTRKFCRTILSYLTPKFIRWPTLSGPDILLKVRSGFSSLPGCVGVIDSTHIPIKSPHEDEGSYINRKGFHSLILQGICDDKRKFTDVFCGCTGRCHDATVLRSAPIYEEISKNKEKYIPEISYIIGDQAYPLLNWLMKKFPETGTLSTEKCLFNKCLSAKRQLIEQTFGILKGRFRKLKFMDISKTIDIPEIVIAACTLHNICSDTEEDLAFFFGNG